MAVLKPYKRRQLLEAIVKQLGLAQIGQIHDHTTSDGSEACTHVCWQFIIYAWKGILVTIDELSRVSGYTLGDVGMDSTNIDRIIKHYKLPYVATFRTPGPRTGIVGDWSANDIMRTAREVGPVQVAVPYGYYPLNESFDPLNVPAPNGFALEGGRADLGFAGNHAIVMFTARWLRRVGDYRPRDLDPDHHYQNHGYDRITGRQFARMWNRNLTGKSYGQFAYVPTEPWQGLPAGADLNPAPIK